MDERIRELLKHYFHDSLFTDAHYEYETNTLTLTLQCAREWDCFENWKSEAYTYRLIFEGVRYHVLETELGGQWMDMQFLVGEFLPSARRRKAEEEAGAPLLHYAMHLHHGYAEILCRAVRVERMAGGLPPLPESQTQNVPQPFSRTECRRTLTLLQYGSAPTVMQMTRLRRTLEKMAENGDEELPALLRRILALPGRFLLATAARLLGECGTADDLPLLYAHLPETKKRPDVRRVLLDAIDALSEKETEDTVAF